MEMMRHVERLAEL